jgi:hypothetical protein
MLHYIYARKRSPCTYDTVPQGSISIQRAAKDNAHQTVMHER